MNKVTILKNAKTLYYTNDGSKKRELIIKDVTRQLQEQGCQTERIIIEENTLKVKDSNVFVLLPKELKVKTSHFRVRSKDLIIYIDSKPLFIQLKDIKIIDSTTFKTKNGIIKVMEVKQW